MKNPKKTAQAVIDAVRESVRAREHQLFADRLVAQLDAMRKDPEEWQSYGEECEMFGGYGRGAIHLEA